MTLLTAVNDPTAIDLRPPAPDEARTTPRPDELRLDPVDLAGVESFPASDPPGWSGCGAGTPVR